MKILVMSDSHSALSFMRRAIDCVKPDMLLHLGDYYDDAVAIQEEYPELACFQVPGNCDFYRAPPGAAEIMIKPVRGVNLYMTHGHRHGVKSSRYSLIAAARAAGAQAALYGHTHIADCYQEPDGLWVLNPGSAGYYGGSAGLIEIEDKKIVSCRILGQEDLEEFV